jgi:predicted small lipoprotein YifL
LTIRRHPIDAVAGPAGPTTARQTRITTMTATPAHPVFGHRSMLAAVMAALLLMPLAGCQQAGRLVQPPPETVAVPVMAPVPAHLPQSTLLSSSYMAADRLTEALIRQGMTPKRPFWPPALSASTTSPPLRPWGG